MSVIIAQSIKCENENGAVGNDMALCLTVFCQPIVKTRGFETLLATVLGLR